VAGAVRDEVVRLIEEAGMLCSRGRLLDEHRLDEVLGRSNFRAGVYARPPLGLSEPA
jgi:hypothetical protein